jgi:hypothetical protein
MKTPMQELIEQLKQKIENQVQFRDEFEDGVVQGLEEALDLAEDMLEKEKEVIIDAFDKGKWDSIAFKATLSENYYNETFNTKEK